MPRGFSVVAGGELSGNDAITIEKNEVSATAVSSVGYFGSPVVVPLRFIVEWHRCPVTGMFIVLLHVIARIGIGTQME